MKKSLYDINIIFILSIVLTIVVGIFNNADALFHEQEFNNEQISDASKEFIINLIDSVNSISNEYYQYESDIGKESVNNNNKNNMTIVNKTNEYIGNLEKIISLAK